MITLALTGSIGMGKSTVAAMFADAGVPVFDADAVVRRLQGPGGRLVPLIEARFPGTTLDGEVDRDALSSAVLGDRDELAALEAIVHPAVHHERTRFIVEHGDLFALILVILVLANVLMLVLGLALRRHLALVLRIPPRIMLRPRSV